MIDPDAAVEDPADFFGQGSLIRRVFSRIGAERPQSIAVIGGKKSGKTSLMVHISDPGVAARHLEGADAYIFLRFRSERGLYDEPESFLAAFAERLPAAASGENLYESIRQAIEGIHAAGRRIIVFMDDFHFITGNDAFPLEFFSFLRSMANNYNLAFVTTSSTELQELCVAKEIQESPFFNIFTNMHLGMISLEEAEAMASRCAGLDAAQAGRAAAWCGGSPYLLKKASAWLARGGAGEDASEAEYGASLLAELAPFFEDLVSALRPEAFKPLQAVIRGKAPSPSEAHSLSPLVKQGFLVDGEPGWSASSLSFDLFLRKSFSARMLKGQA